MTINERTTIPLFWAAACIPFLIGGILWMASIDSKASIAIDVATESKKEVTGTKDMLIDIRERVIRIEERVKK